MVPRTGAKWLYLIHIVNHTFKSEILYRRGFREKLKPDADNQSRAKSQKKGPYLAQQSLPYV
jgi:hypothetical protein